MAKPEGKVVRDLSLTELVINLGSEHQIHEGDRVLVYSLGEEITDPSTGESLGRLEVVRGKGEVRHLQPKMSTIRSTEKRIVRRQNARFLASEPFVEELQEVAPFDGARVGDMVRVL